MRMLSHADRVAAAKELHAYMEQADSALLDLAQAVSDGYDAQELTDGAVLEIAEMIGDTDGELAG